MGLCTMKRIYYWDNLKGILIYLVVFAHCLYDLTALEGIRIVVDSVYFFHMPAFIFISGYFGKSEHSRSAESILRLVTAYIIFNGLIGVVFYDYSILTPKYSYWYLLALIVWRIFTPWLSKFKYILYFLVGIALLIGFIPEINNTFALCRIVGFYPFYMAGYLLSENVVNKHLISSSRKVIYGIFCLALSCLSGSLSYSIFNLSKDDFKMFPYSDCSNGGLIRASIFLTATFAIGGLLFLVKNKKLPLLSKFGYTSLSIFLCHRIFTIYFSNQDHLNNSTLLIVVSGIYSLALCLLFSSSVVHNTIENMLSAGAALLQNRTGYEKYLRVLKPLFLIIIFMYIIHNPLIYSIDEYKKYLSQNTNDIDQSTNNISDVAKENDIKYRIMTSSQREQLDNAFRILFVGDLILLEDQVKRGYKNNLYDFSDLFEYTERYIKDADLAIGVFEGPLGGEKIGFSTSNYDDGKYLALNYPDSFAQAVKNAGFDLVTTANNHLLDKGEAAASRTLDILDALGLEHIGSYRSKSDKDNQHIKILEVSGMRFAVLAYTYGCNGHSTDEFFDGQYEYITSILPDVNSPYFEHAKKIVEADFLKAKSKSPDFIIVLPHLGTQFINTPDENQKAWYDVFYNLGADIVLGDHSHSIQPVGFRNSDNKKMFELYCPGNYANVYRDYHGDATAMVEVYIDRNTKEILAGGVIPMYVQSPVNGNFRPLPIYDIVYNQSLQNFLSTDDIARASLAHSLITNVMFRNDISMSMIQDRYYFDKEGFIRKPVNPIVLTEALASSSMLRLMHSAHSICFIGDSITDGTKNGGFPWYEPIQQLLPNNVFYNISFGGATSKDILKENIPSAQLYVIAIGTNDVRYRDSKRCAMTPEEYIAVLSQLRKKIHQLQPDAKIIFIAPWTSIDGDPFSKLPYDQKLKLNHQYSESLKEYCHSTADIYIDPNPYLDEKIHQKPVGFYLLDHIHPNVSHGIYLYSEAVLLSAETSAESP